MIQGLIVLIALIWLLSRLYEFLRIPVENIVQGLNIKIPPSTKVSIDKISTNSITIHWENEPLLNQDLDQEVKKDFITHYIIYINNLQLGVFPNRPQSLYTCCSLTNLKPSTQYQLDFITVNNMGFINRLPSIFIMTKSEKVSDDKDIHLIKNRKWRRNTVSSPTVANGLVPKDSNKDSDNGTAMNSMASINLVSNVQDDLTPSYANLTSLKDLETYSIEDLKKILICAQEDLHDVLNQQASCLQDFKESKEELLLELDNLKNHWSHELDFRKSLKSNIKSLENNKLLGDMKTEKLNQKIVKTREKLSKMKSDIIKWEEIEQTNLNPKNSQIKYNKLNKKLKETIKDLETKIANVQSEVNKLDKENKELNILKKSSSSTNLSSLKNNFALTNINNTNNTSNNLSKQQSTNNGDETTEIINMIKKINTYVSKDTGLLSSQGEEYLSTLNEDNQLVKSIKEQLDIDSQNYEYWMKKKRDLMDKISHLEKKYDEIDIQNKQLRATLLTQPYQSEVSDNQNLQHLQQQINCFLPELTSFNSGQQLSTTDSNSFVNLSTSNSNPSNSTSQLRSTQTPLYKQNANYIIPSMTKHEPLLQSSRKDGIRHPLSAFPISIPTTTTTTTTAMGNVTANAQQSYSTWSIPNISSTANGSVDSREGNQYNRIPPNEDNDLDQPFDYDNVNHLITGLQDMIYNENDNPDEISNYSKGFTTDQLDNYWTSQKSLNINSSTVDSVNIPTADDQKLGSLSNIEGNIRTPVTSHTHEFVTPLSKSPFMMAPGQPSQSLLAATLSDRANLSPFASDSLSLRLSESAGFYRPPTSSMGPHAVSNNLTSLFSNNSNNNAFSQSLTPHNSNILSSPSQNIPFPNDQLPVTDGYRNNMIFGSQHSQEPLDVSVQTSDMPEKNNKLGERVKSPSTGLFHSSSFNFLWHHNSPTKSADANEPVDPNNNENRKSITDERASPDHRRNKSDGSNMSIWTNRLSLKSKAISTSSQESSTNDKSERKDSNIDKNEFTNQSNSSSTGSGRKMSRLLSRTTMNDIFKFRNHDNHL